MATTLENLIAARDSMAAELAGEAAARAALVAAGKPAPVTYTNGNETVNWTGYYAEMTAQIANLNKLIAALDLYEVVEHGY